MRFLVAALAVHVALALAFAAKKAPMPTVVAPASEVEVDLSAEESAPPPEPLRETTPSQSATATAMATKSSTATTTEHATSTKPETVVSEPAASGSWSAPIFVAGGPAPMDTRIPGSFFLPSDHGGAPEGTAPAPASTSGGLVEGLHQLDDSLGLGSGGPVVSAAHAIPVEAMVSIDGAGTFDVLTDPTGRVVSVRVADVTSDDPEWQKVARALLAQLAGHPLRVPHGANGVAVRMRVEVIARMPSGAKAGHALTPTSTGGGMEDRYYGMRGDLSDIGASAVRTVHARITASRAL